MNEDERAVRVIVSGLGPEELAIWYACEVIAQAIKPAIEQLADACKKLGEIWVKAYELEKERKNKNEKFPLDLIRIKIHHQVTCRKPKNLIKKVIR